MNYYTWVPGSKETFDSWAEYGGENWTWDKCKKYFRKVRALSISNLTACSDVVTLQAARYHDDDRKHDPKFSRLGRDGPLHISHADLLPELAPFREALISAWKSKSLPIRDDIYSGKMEGLTHCVTSIYNGVRSDSSAFVNGRPNVEVMSSTVAKKINFEGDKAISVTVLNHDGSEGTFKAKQEIILSGGVFETPKILLLSGVGPRVELARHGIQQVVASEHVGENLLDHPIMPHVFRLKDGMGLDDILLRKGKLLDDAKKRYDESKTGPLASGLLELVAFPRIDDRLEKHKAYRDAKKANGDKDPFGPEGQPHFEIDFVVRRSLIL